MDWTGYPKNLPPAHLVETHDDLARFLTDSPAEHEFVLALLDLIGGAELLPDRAVRLAVAFPREVTARAAWSTYTPTPTAAALLDALVQIPDAPDDAPPELLPVLINRVMITALPATSEANVNVMHRLDSAQPWSTLQCRVPLPTVDVDPVLLGDTDGARLTIRLTREQANP